MAARDIQRADVEAAIKVRDDPGQQELVRSLRFGPATKYRLVHEGRFYNSKEIAGIAHGIATDVFWNRDDLSGGVDSGQGAEILRRLGFFVDDGLLYEIDRLQVYRGHGKPAPYQFVLLLWAIARARTGRPRLAPFLDVQDELSEILAPFALAQTAPNPAEPWLALRGTGWWELQLPPESPDITDGDVRRLNIVAGLSERAHAAVIADDLLARSAIDVIGQMIGTEPAYPALLERLGLSSLLTRPAGSFRPGTANVLIQPSYGNRQAQQNWANTLANDVDFTTGPLRTALTQEQVSGLRQLHPNGRARFWGTTHVQDSRMDELRTGDVVLFTGQSNVLAVGEVGFIFRSADAGNALWPADPDNGPYQNVYSLLNFQPTEIPYSDLRKLTSRPGSTGADNYMGARLLRDDAAQRVIDGLLIETNTALNETEAQGNLFEPGTVVDDEAHNAPTARPTPARPGFIAERNESALVVEYKQFLTERAHDLRKQKRLKSNVGFSDLYLIPTSDGGRAELVEAKSNSSHGKVREALAQLLDYVAHADVEIDVLTALFPTAPTSRDTEWLGRYGIGCVYKASDGDFISLPAPRAAVATIRFVWQSRKT